MAGDKLLAVEEGIEHLQVVGDGLGQEVLLLGDLRANVG